MADTEDTRECEAMCKLFVGGLNRDTSDDAFFEYFGQFGNLVDKVVIKDTQTKTSRGFGFITYDCSDSVEKVFQSLPHTIDGKTLDVKRAIPRDLNSPTANGKVNMADTEDTRECEAMRKLFVGGLNQDTTDDTFFEYFGQFGNLVDKVVIKDTQTNTSRGFGFITYDCSDSVEKVFQSRPHTIDSKTLDVKRAIPREFNSPSAHAKVTKLFVGGVGPDLTPEDLQEYIESRHPTSVGTIDKIDFLKDKATNQNKGFGFLECSSTDLADRLAISEQHFTLKGKKMAIKKAEPKPGEGGQDRGRGRGGFSSVGGRGRGGGRGGGSNGYINDISTGYAQFGGNAGGYHNFQQTQAAGGNYGGYGVNQGQGRGGWNSGGGNRYQPY